MNDLITIQRQKAADQKHCFSCATAIHTSAAQCPHCGAQQPAMPTQATNQEIGRAEPIGMNQMYCHGCGGVLHKSAKACPKCGAEQGGHSSIPNGGSSRTVAIFLALLLGGLGFHKFYLGRVFQGLIYLAFFWTFIPAFIALIEAIYYITLSEEEFKNKYR